MKILRNITIKSLFVENWKPKLLTLMAAVVVWVIVDRLYVRDVGSEWGVDDIRLSMPE